MSFSYKNCTIFVGIDQSLNSTGYYVSELEDPNTLTEDYCGLIKPGGRRGGSRLLYIHDQIEGILKDYPASKILVCMEGYAYNYRKGKVFELGEVGGIIKMLCHRLGIRCISVPPTELKKFVCGKSSASKEQVMKEVGEKQNDKADAKGLSMIAKEICLKSTTDRKKLEVVHNCIKNSREEVHPPKYKRTKNKKIKHRYPNQIAGRVPL